MKRVVILGGGSAGLMAANRLRRAFRRDDLELTVIERRRRHIFQPGFTLLVFGLEEPENLIRPTRDLLLPGVKLMTDSVVKVEPEEKKVLTEKSGDVRYDYLVICTGARVDAGLTPGLKQGIAAGRNVFTFYNMEGALGLREALDRFDRGTIVSSICEMPIKCPAAPMKFIMMAQDFIRRKGLRHKCRFIFTTPLPAVFSREPYASLMAGIFKEMDIETIANFTPALVDHEKGVIEDFRGRKVKFDLACVTPAHTGDAAMINSPGVGDQAGWVNCDKHKMTARKYDDIYSLGDAPDFPTAKTASGARKQADVLVERMRSLINNEAPVATYDGEIICPVLTRFGKAMFAHFNYEDPLGPAWESSMYWQVKVHMLRPLYFNLMLPGLM
ncbi:MAG: NAD(P)/FAD-dependent oxidoreductase [Desulfobacterales bacterium]|nr:NAD(P)/FAD-dependent oxidoreductase [Desulfobacterales bacterium]